MKKEKWISIYKAILIILMVLGHTTTIFGKYIYTFHVAAFFLISGYLFKDKEEDFIVYLKRKMKTLLIPYIEAVFLLTVIGMVLSKIGKVFYGAPITLDFFYSFIRYLKVVDLAGATWFIPVLFFTEIGFKLLTDLLKNSSVKNKKIVRFIICLILAFWGYTYYRTNEFLGYFIEKVFLSIFIFALGNSFKLIESKINKWMYHILFIFSIAIIGIYSQNWWQFISWTTNSYPNIVTFSALTCSGGYITYYLAKILSKLNLKWLIYIGDHSLDILIYHFLGFKLLFGILHIFGFVSIEQTQSLVPLYDNTIYGLITTIFGILFALSFASFIKFIKNIKLESIQKHKDLLICLALIIIIGIFNSFIFDSKNFFTFDDFSHIKTVSSSTYKELFTIFPNQVYNSRPVGQVIMKILNDLFGVHFLYHAIAMQIIHIINAILVYFMAKNMFSFDRKKSFMISLIFGVFPTSIMASTWEAAMFDLFGCTLVLICLLLLNHFYKTQNIIIKIIDSVFIVITYYLGLRTKEMIIALPCLMLLYAIWKQFFLEKKKIKEIMKNSTPILISLIVMIIYFGYTRILNSSSEITTDPNNPYYFVFNPIMITLNFFRYIYLYFNIFDVHLSYMGYNSLVYLVCILFFVIVILYALYKILKKDYKLLIMGCGFTCMIAPVLPMQNMQHILYLYIPSIFMSMIIVYMIDALKIKINTQKLLTFILILYACCNTSGVINHRNWWFLMTSQDKKTYHYLEKNKRENIKSVCVNHVDENQYYSYYYGPGDILKIAYGDKDIEVKINDDNCEEAMIIDCENNNICKIVKDE